VPTITSIKPQKNQKRVNIYLDNKFGFGIDLANFIKLGLKVEQELSEKDIKEIVIKSEFQKSLDKLLRFATLRPRSEKEITDYFRRKKVHTGIQNELIGRLTRLDLLDDKKFALWWIGQRQEFKPRGKRMLIYELTNKGVNKEIIEGVLAETQIDEEKMAKELLDKKAYRWKNLPNLEAKQKMSLFLAQKGFGWDVISKLIKNDTSEE